MTFHELTESEQKAFIASLTEADWNWLEFLLKLEGHISAALELLYRGKQEEAKK